MDWSKQKPSPYHGWVLLGWACSWFCFSPGNQGIQEWFGTVVFSHIMFHKGKCCVWEVHEEKNHRFPQVFQIVPEWWKHNHELRLLGDVEESPDAGSGWLMLGGILNVCDWCLLLQGHMDEDVQAALLQIIQMRQGLVCWCAPEGCCVWVLWLWEWEPSGALCQY